MLRYPGQLHIACLLLCGVFGVGLLNAQPANSSDGTPIGRDDFAPNVGGASASAPAAFHPPLPGRLAKDGDMLYAVSDPPESGVYRHPAGLFVLRFPGPWRLMRSASGGYVAYTFSAEVGRVPPKQLRTGIKVNAVAMSDVFRRQQLTAEAILKHFLPGMLRDEPGMRLAGGVTKARLGNLEAATCVLEGKLKDLPGEWRREFLVAEKEGVAFQLLGFAPAGDYAAFRPAFLKIAADSSFGRSGPARRDESLEARKIVQRYKTSVVSIYAAGDAGAGTGSGFIISRDGYVLTNYHVAFDTRTGQPMKTFTVEWDESLRRPKVPAQLVGGKFRMSPFQLQHGIDVALLKIAPGDYDPLPLSPLAEVEAGDGVVTLGYPSRGMLEGVSLTVTTGVVTRFNRGPDGDIVSALIDAAITHGSSGGPCVSLVTGGVIGLNSFGVDVQLDARYARLNDLIKYYGVVPIDAAIREFPLVCLPGMNPQASGYDFFDCLELSKYFLSVGSFNAAEQLALRAVSVEPQQALARMRVGECRFEAAQEQEREGDRAKAQALVEAARKAYGEALARDPRQATALAAFARLELQQNRLTEAADLAARAAAADPEGWEGNLLLADINLRQERFDEALRYVEKAKAVVGGLIVNPHVTAALIRTAKKDYENARKEWAEAARISPVYLPARLGVAAYFEQVKQPDAAVAEYRRVLTDFPENGEVLGRIGLCLNGAGKTAEAADYLAQSVRRCRAAGQAPDESVLMFLGDLLMQRPDSAEAAPVFALYLYHHRQGQWAALASLKLAGIHAQHQAAGLARAHARLAIQLRNAPDVAQAAAQYPEAPLSLSEIQALAGVLQYPLALAAEIVAASPLGFTVDEQQMVQLQQQGLPEPILKAILQSLSQHPPMASAPGPGAGAMPPEMAVPGAMPPAPASPLFPTEAPPPAAAAPGLVGTWVATGMTAQQMPFRSVIIFGDLGVFTSDTWVGLQSLGRMSGRYWMENGRLILQPEGAQPFAPGFQVQGDTMIMDVVNFAPGVRFVREANPGGFPP